MNKKANKNDGIKDSISKLFILRDSCTGTSITQKDAPNIIWFEGAAVLLQQGVDKLKSAQHKIDSGGEDVSKEFYVNVRDTVTKLIVLKNSCRGVSLIEESDENANWFEGAESIICEVIDQLQKALQKTESQTAISSAVDSSESKESAPSDTAAASVPKAAKEESEGEVADEAEKKAAAG
jgi:hypothetical protein